MRVLVCGGRDYSDRPTLAFEMHKAGPTHVIAGGANGADALAVEWALDNAVPHTVYPADWDQHGKAAGPIRNAFMLEDGKPDLVLAFPGGRGTADMVRKAERAGVPVRLVDSSSTQRNEGK